MRNIAGFFSMLMPGFGQVYNRQFVKGVFFIVIELLENIFGRINKAIQLDFNGMHQEALNIVSYDYMLFYPGFYVYAVWDAWFYAKAGADKAITAIPFLIAGILGEIFAIFSSKLAVPTLTVGLIMIVPMIASMIFYRKQ
ncbi:MAG: hypothetical protein ACO1OT_10030 [Heyndrickxia sp.]